MITRAAAIEAWREIARGLAASGDKSDRDLAHSVIRYVDEMPVVTGRDGAQIVRVPSDPSVHAGPEYQK